MKLWATILGAWMAVILTLTTAGCQVETTEYELTVTVNGNGSVNLTSGTYEEDTTATLTATPASGCEFVGWSGDVSGTSSTIQVIMDSDKHVVANFTPVTTDANSPINVVLAIDCSGSMLYSDPNALRIQAAWDFIQHYHDNENVKFNVILWSFNSRSSGFTRDLDDLQAFLETYYNSSTTNYIGTIDRASSEFQQEIKAMVRDDVQSENVSGMKCIVLFFSDGLPSGGGTAEDPVMQDENDIIDAIQQMEDELLHRGVAQFIFHTFFLSTLFYGADGQLDPDYPMAVNLLTMMANTGNGIYTEFVSADAIDFINVVDMGL